jgi:hypothetical protein
MIPVGSNSGGQEPKHSLAPCSLFVPGSTATGRLRSHEGGARPAQTGSRSTDRQGAHGASLATDRHLPNPIRPRNLSPAVPDFLVTGIAPIEIPDGLNIRSDVRQRRRSHRGRMHTRAQCEPQRFGNRVRCADESIIQCAYSAPVNMHMRILGHMGTAPHSIGDRPFCDNPEAGRKRLGDDVIYRLPVGNVDADLDRLERSTPYGPERCGPIAAIADVSDLASILRADDRLIDAPRQCPDGAQQLPTSNDFSVALPEVARSRKSPLGSFRLRSRRGDGRHRLGNRDPLRLVLGAAVMVLCKGAPER